MRRARGSRYHPLLVALHWLLALLIIGLLCVGFFVLRNMPNSDPRKLNILVAHMAGGIFLLVLMIVRVIIRVRSAPPRVAATASAVHAILYVLVFSMIASGWCTGFAIRGAFQPHGGHLPATFAVFSTFRIHTVLAALLTVSIAGHVAAALYRHFAAKDASFRRMWFGTRRRGVAAETAFLDKAVN